MEATTIPSSTGSQAAIRSTKRNQKGTIAIKAPIMIEAKESEIIADLYLLHHTMQ